jgi:predicted DNA-binding transcriptional regulator AlpA
VNDLMLSVDEAAKEPPRPDAVEFIGIPEWCRRVGCSRESGYRAARRDEIPGLFRIGRLKRINWVVFVEAAARWTATDQTAFPECLPLGDPAAPTRGRTPST